MSQAEESAPNVWVSLHIQQNMLSRFHASASDRFLNTQGEILLLQRIELTVISRSYLIPVFQTTIHIRRDVFSNMVFKN